MILLGMDPKLENINLWLYAGAAIGSFLPDVDHPYSVAGKFAPVWMRVKHREQTHSLFGVIVSGALGTILNPMFGAGVAYGYLLHLGGDRLTYMGMKEGLRFLLWPVHVRKLTKRD
jgi:membrane-bound metal-dependent hydrolase YbcI (DUF457 family)